MNSTIADSSSTIDIPAVTPRNDSSLPPAPKRAVAGIHSPTASAAGNPPPVSIWVFRLQHLTESAVIGAGLQQPPNDSLDLTAELLPELSEFNSAVDINQFLARHLVLVTKGLVSPRHRPR